MTFKKLASNMKTIILFLVFTSDLMLGMQKGWEKVKKI